MTIKDSRYVKINSVNPLYLILGKINEYFEEISGNKKMSPVPTNKSNEIMKRYEELWTKIRGIIRSKNNS